MLQVIEAINNGVRKVRFATDHKRLLTICSHYEVLQVCLSRVKNLKFCKHEALIDLRTTLRVRCVFDKSLPTRGQVFLHHYKVHYLHYDHPLVGDCCLTSCDHFFPSVISRRKQRNFEENTHLALNNNHSLRLP